MEISQHPRLDSVRDFTSHYMSDRTLGPEKVRRGFMPKVGVDGVDMALVD